MVTLRELLRADSDMLLEWRNLPAVAQYMYTDHIITPDEHRKWFAAIHGDVCRKYWIVVLDGSDVGLANLYAIDRHHRRAYWAFYLADPAVRGRGVGSAVEYKVLRYVFDELGLNRLCCEVLSVNEPVIQMHKSFGFKQEGYYRQHVIKNNTPLDVVVLALLNEEWQAQRPSIEKRLRSRNLI